MNKSGSRFWGEVFSDGTYVFQDHQRRRNSLGNMEVEGKRVINVGSKKLSGVAKRHESTCTVKTTRQIERLLEVLVAKYHDVGLCFVQFEKVRTSPVGD